ncbi:hypothetical protein GGS23DRAFT_577770 [Durotheca rogersii]|uniref:uncharacterized protein n=1 Tax=Durotheca rogersii TaxID=419775 RepID=UPI00221EF395|nr:uncharacterized protein GGS23DRAFT_577770 [Durotheca rogersii]KAI5861253.1 hypothetical protein GGS23DRAFT_577770 [Durotheca rogersii]
MSSVLSTGNAPAQRVPAWKRLGLKLKPASDEPSQDATLPTSTAAVPVPNHRRENPASPTNPGTKRKSSGVPALDHSVKKAKRDVPPNQTPPSQTPKKVKSVSFAPESATEDRSSPTAATNARLPKKKNQAPPRRTTETPGKRAKKQASVNLEPALAYLRQWHSSRDTWKFNKNHQTKLLEQIFADETTIPAADIHLFYEYIRGLKGAVRTRLRELASGIKSQDMEQGPDGFSASRKEAAERKYREYEGVIAAFLSEPREPGKRRFNEVDYVLRTADMEMQRRVVKRMRTQMVLDELSDSEGAETASTTATATTTTAGDSGYAASSSATAADRAESEKRLRLNDAPPQRTKRRRKARTATVEDEEDEATASEDASSSSSSESSDSDSETDAGAARGNTRSGGGSSSSSSSSSSEDSEAEDEPPSRPRRPRRNEADTSSSSSSSSEASDTGSGSEDEDDDDGD